MNYKHFLTFKKSDYFDFIFFKLYLIIAAAIKVLIILIINLNKYYCLFLFYFNILFLSCYVNGNLWAETARMSDLQQVYYNEYLK